MRTTAIPTDLVVSRETLENYWLAGTTCRGHTSVQAEIDLGMMGQWVVMKHKGHSDWCGGSIGQATCKTYFAVFQVGKPFSCEVLWKGDFQWHGRRWSRSLLAEIRAVCRGAAKE